VVIRFNTDGYQHYKDKIVSPWTKTGKLKHADEWNARLQRLKRWVDYYLSEAPTKLITCKYLYYNKTEK
jgi:hypothetical protein